MLSWRVERLLRVGCPTALALAITFASAQAFDFRDRFLDAEDGALDVSGTLSQGGFIPVPIVITEPAVDKGLGFAGQFIHPPSSNGAPAGRTVIGGAVTGNGSWGGGFLQQGSFADGNFLYRLGGGLADVTLPIFPFGGSSGFDYGDRVKFGFANLRYRVPDTSFSFGPRFIYRTSDVALDGEGPVAERVTDLVDRIIDEHQYVAVGISAHIDSRNNQFTPTDGINAILRYDDYSSAWGSDQDFGVSALLFHGFHKFGESWSAGAKVRLEGVTSNAPFFMAPAVDLRGVQYGRYQGDTALSLEAELRRQLTDRWAVVAFGGYGETFVNSSKLYQAESGIWTFGAGVRYRLARKFGIDVGLDVARGPDSTIFYIQFGHAWAQSMD